MKQTRRKELKTNELRAFLEQMRETFVQNSNYIIGGLVAVVIILIIGVSVQRSRARAEEERWHEYSQIQSGQGSGDPIDRAKALADSTSGDRKLGSRALVLYGDLLREKAMNISPTVNNPDERIQLLEQAKDIYDQVIQKYASQPETVLEARMKLASVYETLYLEGKSDIELARQQYKEVLKHPTSAFATFAQQQLDTLAERTKRMQIVASRPAELAPAGVATTQSVPKFNVKKMTLPPGPRVVPTTAPAAK